VSVDDDGPGTPAGGDRRPAKTTDDQLEVVWVGGEVAGAVPAPEPESGALRSDARLFRRVPALALLTIGSSAVSAVVAVVAARRLGPGRYGQAEAVVLAYSIGGLLQLGAFSGGVRNAIHRRAMGEHEAATRDQNVGWTFELLVSLVPGFALAVVAPFAHSHVVQLGFLLAPIALGLSSMAGFLGSIEIGTGRAAKATLVASAGAVVAGLATLVLLVPMGAPAVYVGPMAGSLVSVLWLGARQRGQGLRWHLDLRIAGQLIRQGFALAVNGVAYWCYRWIGPASVAVGLGTVWLGIYSIAAAPLALAFGGLIIGARLFFPGFWQDIARGDRDRWVPEGDRLTSSLIVSAALVATAGQVLFPWFVGVFPPSFAAAIPIFAVLALEIPLFLGPQVPSLVLDSTVVNRQRLHALVWLSALALNLVANVVVLALHLGAMAVAWNDVAAQALILVTMFTLGRPYQGPLLERRRQLGPGMAGLVGTVVVCGLLTGLTVARPSTSLASMGVRAALAVGGWLVVLVAFWAVRRAWRPDTAPPPAGAVHPAPLTARDPAPTGD